MKRIVAFFLLITLVIAGTQLAGAQGDGKRTPITSKNADQVKQVALWGRGSYRSVAWSPDGKTIAIGGSVGVWLYKATDIDAAPRLLAGHTDMVNDVAFSPDGKMLASASDDGTVRLWDVENGESKATLKIDRERVKSVAFSPDGSLLAGGSSSSTVRLWDVESGQPKTTLKGDDGTVASVAFSPDGKMLASGIAREVQLWGIRKSQS